MRTNLNMILAMVGVSFSLVVLTAPAVSAQTWYDSEGRPVVIDGKRVIRKEVMDEEQTKVASKAEESSIIPKALVLRPELSVLKPRAARYYPYRGNHYGYYRATPYYQGCYRPSRPARSGLHLNYRRGNFSIRAKY